MNNQKMPTDIVDVLYYNKNLSLRMIDSLQPKIAELQKILTDDKNNIAAAGELESVMQTMDYYVNLTNDATTNIEILLTLRKLAGVGNAPKIIPQISEHAQEITAVKNPVWINCTYDMVIPIDGDRFSGCNTVEEKEERARKILASLEGYKFVKQYKVATINKDSVKLSE